MQVHVALADVQQAVSIILGREEPLAAKPGQGAVLRAARGEKFEAEQLAAWRK